MKTFKEFLTESNASLIDRFEKFAGQKIKPGYNKIQGFGVVIDDNMDGTYIELDADDKQTATALSKALKAAKFKVTRSGDTQISVE